MNWTDLTDKVVIITGGAAGIGLSVAKGFVEVGAKVVIADFAEEVGAKAVVEANEAGPGEVIFTRCDVTSKKDVEGMVQTAIDQFGGVDVLVNNAGINVPRLLVDPAGKEELTEEIWDQVLTDCLLAVYLWSDRALQFKVKSTLRSDLCPSFERGTDTKKGASPPKRTKSAHFFTFGPFYVIFGSIWPSKQVVHQFFVSKISYKCLEAMMQTSGDKNGANTPRIPPNCLFFHFFARFT